MTDTTPEVFKPPYMAFATFWTYIKDLGSRPLPPALDRSMMTNKSGTDQANLLGALKAFGLIDEKNTVLPTLTTLVEADEAARVPMLANIIRTYYPGPMNVSEVNGTEAALQESFKKDYGLEAADTRRKAVTFFLHAAKAADLTLSPNFKQTRQVGPRTPRTPGQPRTPRANKNGGNGGGGVQGGGATKSSGDTYSVDLRSGGSVSVALSVNLFTLSPEDRGFVMNLVDQLTGYAKPVPAESHGFEQPAQLTEEDLL